MISASPRKLNRIVRAVRYGGMILPLKKSVITDAAWRFPSLSCSAALHGSDDDLAKAATYVYSTAKSSDGNEIYAICSEKLHKAIMGD